MLQLACDSSNQFLIGFNMVFNIPYLYNMTKFVCKYVDFKKLETVPAFEVRLSELLEVRLSELQVIFNEAMKDTPSDTPLPLSHQDRLKEAARVRMRELVLCEPPHEVLPKNKEAIFTFFVEQGTG